MYKDQKEDNLIYPPSIDFTEMVKALTHPQAFPFALPEKSPLSLVQTHASAVVLTADLVYKLKKPQNFGFFDYSTPELRQHFCQQEVLLNAPLAPGVYLGIAPVVALHEKRYRFGPTLPPNDTPLPGTSFEGGMVVDYAVVMERLPDDATLEAWVQADRADLPRLAEIARTVASFHATTRTDEHVASFGSLDVILGNWEENFAQIRPYVGRTIDAATYDHIVMFVRHFLQRRTALFANRMHEGHIRDCHGDLRLQHIYILEKTEPSVPRKSRIVFLDRIEFNERFRYSDVASEIAFLTMELDIASRSDLAQGFVDAYVAVTGDETLREVLPFYLCYRACVRGKVLSFQLDEQEVPEAQRTISSGQAQAFFSLAAHYANAPTRPLLVMIGGLMGTGKSTLALSLQHESGWALFSSDALRKRLVQLDPAHPQADSFGQGVYQPAWTARTYDALRAEAGNALSSGRSVLLDASFVRRADRQMMAHEAIRHGAAVVFVECVCSREAALMRLGQRWRTRTEASAASSKEASLASDGRPDLYDAQHNIWEAFVADEKPHVRHLVVTTTQPLAHYRERVLDVLGLPRLCCKLEPHIREIS